MSLRRERRFRRFRHATCAVLTAMGATLVTLIAACGHPALPPAKRVVIGAMDSVADSAVPGPFQDTLHITLYNRGTKLLHQDSLTTALAVLDSAVVSADTAVSFRAAFNDGWDYLVTARRSLVTLRQGGAKAEALLTAFEHDTALRRILAEDTLEADSITGAVVVPKAVLTEPLSDRAKQDMASAYVDMQLDSAVAKYRAALLVHPADRDAKWNYELAYRVATARKGQLLRNRPVRGTGNGKRRSRGKGRARARGKARTMKGQPRNGNKGVQGDKVGDKAKQNTNGKGSGVGQKSDKQGKGAGNGNKANKNGGTPPTVVPPVEQLRLPSQQALQLLDAVGQRERKPTQTIRVPTAVTPQGKDW